MIHSTAYIRDGSVIDKNADVGVMACIGVRGMTLRRDKDCKIHWRRLGSNYPVILKKGSYIGARTTIMRGTKWSTTIGEGTFIGPNCSIGHDNKIGNHCMILTGTITCGSVEIGDHSYIAPGCTIKNGVKIGKFVNVGIGSLVLDDIKNGVHIMGRPAKDVERYRKERLRMKELMGLEI